MHIVCPTSLHIQQLATIYNLSVLPFLKIYSNEENAIFTLKETPETFKQQLANKKIAALMIDDVIAGYAIFYQKNDYCVWLSSIYVHPDHQRIGAGTMLLSHVETWAVSMKAEIVALETHEKAKWAHEFYKKNGYSRVDKELHELPNNRILDKPPVPNRPIFIKHL